MTITKSATATLSRVSVGLTRHDTGHEAAILLSVDVGGFSSSLYLSIEDFDILRETLTGFDVHEALQLEEDAKAPLSGFGYGSTPDEIAEGKAIAESNALVLGGYRDCSITFQAGPGSMGSMGSGDELEDDTVDPVGGDIETATMLKSKTHDCWVEVVPNFENGPRYVLKFRSPDGWLHSRTGDSWGGSRELAIQRIRELEKSGEASVKR